MNDKQLEKMLTDIYSVDIKPSEKLLIRTKSRIQNYNGIKYLLGLCVISNMLMSFGLFYLVAFLSVNIYFKILATLFFTGFLNIATSMVYLNLTGLKQIFNNLNTTSA